MAQRLQCGNSLGHTAAGKHQLAADPVADRTKGQGPALAVQFGPVHIHIGFHITFQRLHAVLQRQRRLGVVSLDAVDLAVPLHRHLRQRMLALPDVPQGTIHRAPIRQCRGAGHFLSCHKIALLPPSAFTGAGDPRPAGRLH